MSIDKRPTPGSYILSYFPDTANPSEPGGKRRPSLVLDPVDFGYGPDMVVLLPSTTAGHDHMDHYVNVRDHVKGLVMPHDPAKGPYIDMRRLVVLSLEPPSRHAFFTAEMDAIGTLDETLFQSIRSRAIAAQDRIDTAPLGYQFHNHPRSPEMRGDITNRPEPGSYVLCQFPYYDNPWEPGGKLRPALVMGYDEEYGFKPPVVVLAYSSSGSTSDICRTPELTFIDVREYVSGLDMPEKDGPFIDFRNIRAIPITRDFFPSGLKRIGALSEDGFAIIKSLAGRYNAIPNAMAVDYQTYQAANPSRGFKGVTNNVEEQFAAVKTRLVSGVGEEEGEHPERDEVSLGRYGVFRRNRNLE